MPTSLLYMSLYAHAAAYAFAAPLTSHIEYSSVADGLRFDDAQRLRKEAVGHRAF